MMAWANAGNISGEATGASSNTSIEAMRGVKDSTEHNSTVLHRKEAPANAAGAVSVP